MPEVFHLFTAVQDAITLLGIMCSIPYHVLIYVTTLPSSSMESLTRHIHLCDFLIDYLHWPQPAFLGTSSPYPGRWCFGRSDRQPIDLSMVRHASNRNALSTPTLYFPLHVRVNKLISAASTPQSQASYQLTSKPSSKWKSFQGAKHS